MSETQLPQVLDRSFRDAVREDALAAYALAAERLYSPADGWGELMFALGIYYNLDRRFEERYSNGGSVRHHRTMRGAELRNADIRVRWKKTGSTLGAPAQMDRTSDVIVEMARLNMSPQPTLLDVPELMNWVIAHSGSARDGLLTMHLAAPRIAGNGRVVGWSESIAIFDARRPHLDLPDIEAPGLPEPMILPELGLDFRQDAPASLDILEDAGSAG